MSEFTLVLLFSAGFSAKLRAFYDQLLPVMIASDTSDCFETLTSRKKMVFGKYSKQKDEGKASLRHFHT